MQPPPQFTLATVRASCGADLWVKGSRVQISPARHYDGRRCLGRTAMRPSAIDHPDRSVAAVPAGPLRGRAGAHREHLRRGGTDPSLLEDQPGQPQTSTLGELSVSVRHEGPLVVKRFLRQLHFTTGGLYLSARLTAEARYNLPGHHI